MKKTFLYVSLVATVLSTVMLSCKKDVAEDSSATGPDITYVTSGILCTIGIGRDYVTDTLVVHPTDGFRSVYEYAYGYTKSGDEVTIINNSNGTVSAKLKIALTSSSGTFTHLGLYGSHLPLAGGTFYPFQLKKEASTETEFIIKRNSVDGRKFSLESKVVPGYYMSAIHPGVNYQPNSTSESKLAFSTKKQEFFFLSK